MSKKSDSTFDQMAYIADWKRKNMKTINSSFKSDFVDEFREACKSLNIKQSDVIRKAMQETIEKWKGGK
ncbi:hypothetical protein [Bulleidia sp. zg-1006]|uniref:hypothetical protein n=1 Tax=Bulleidia sp. zg-1006 TaxID=2806552 RepID=UPI001939CED5|nr:hypothetical protein [Bulleidia sp. zg-1006]QRG86362.1 hypothetical protein JOS54_05775 [Bulleidia sp. zg-1006]